MSNKFCSTILSVFLYMAFVLTFACQIGFPILAIAQASCCDCDKCDAGNYMVNCDLECIQEVRPLAIVHDGDPITINADQQMLNLEVPQKEILARLAAWKKPALKYGRGILVKYAAQMSNASEGAVIINN